MERKKKCAARTNFTLEKGVLILEKLRETWASEQIAGGLFQEEGLSFKTIYRWIYTGLVETDSGLLRQKGKRQKPHETRGRFNIGLSISKRSSSGKNRFYLAVPMEEPSAASMEFAIRALHLYFPLGTFKTATTDRGKKFSSRKRIREALGLSMYFADPYSS